MELHQLRAFVAIVELESFVQAAGRLHVSQPALTRKIHKLEDELKVELFLRAHGRIYLTPAGKTCHRRVRAILRLVDQLPSPPPSSS